MYVLIVDGIPVGLYYSLKQAHKDADFLTSKERVHPYDPLRRLERESLDKWSFNTIRDQHTRPKYYIYRLTERENEDQSEG